MALYHMHFQMIGRSKGRSIVSAVAYRVGEKIRDERLGLVYDYCTKKGVTHSEIIVPEGAPAWMRVRSALWNGVDAVEQRRDSQTAREVDVALPVELTTEEQIAVLREFIVSEFVALGMVADFSLNCSNPENPHASIILTTRRVNKDGFGKKCREWQRKEFVIKWRKAWADRCNGALQRAGHDVRIDHRSYAEQGIKLLPAVHIGRRHIKAGSSSYVTHERLLEQKDTMRENGDAIIADPSIALDAMAKHSPMFTSAALRQWLRQHTLDADQFRQAFDAVMNHRRGPTLSPLLVKP
jgi:ATP-dependent exoDNAse (exonuclease V) alpha subunit